MASPGGIRAGRAYVEIAGDATGLQRAANLSAKVMADLGARIRNIGLAVSAAGSAIAAPLVLSVRAFEQMGSALNDMSARTGATVENLSQLGHAASQTGASIEDVEIGIRKMQRAIGEANAGTKSAVDVFRGLGLSIKAISALNPDQQFDAIAGRIGEIADPTQRAAAALEVFGKSGTKLLPLIADLAALRDEADRLNLTFSTDMAKRADALGDAFTRVSATVKRVQAAIGNALAPTLQRISDLMSINIAAVSRWIDANQGVILAVAGVTAGIVAAGAALVGLGVSLQVASFAVGGLGKAFGLALSSVQGIGAALAFLVSPAGIAAAAVTALGVAVVHYSGLGSDAMQFLMARFNELSKVAKDAIGAIGTALAAGNITAAANVLWAGLRVAWLEGTGALTAVWNSFLDTMKRAFINVAANLQSGFVKSMAEIRKIVTKAESIFDTLVTEIGANILLATNVDAQSTPEKKKAFQESIQQQLDEMHTARADDTQRELDIIEQQRKSLLGQIGKEVKAELLDIDDTASDKLIAAKDALAKALADFNASVNTAQGLSPPGEFTPRPAPAVDLDVDEIKKTMKALDASFGAGGPRSTFAQERASFGKSDDIQKKSLTQLERIERNTRNGGLRFV